LTILEPKEEYTLGEFFEDVMKLFHFEHPFLYVKGDGKLYNHTSNQDLLLKKLLKPDELTLCSTVSILESNQSELKSRRTLNILMKIPTSETSSEKQDEIVEEVEMPSDHSELMKKGGMCPVIHGDFGDDDKPGECPAECKSQ
jgi:hypothetical protein